MTFYEDIEDGVREIVRLLRDNGINTTCSCHHDMTIEIELGNNIDEVEFMARLLVENNYENFKIIVDLRVPNNGFWNRRCTIYLKNWM